MENYAACETCLLLAEADRVLCLLLCFNRLFALDLENEIQLLSGFFCYSWLACLIGLWKRNAPLGNHRFQK